MECKNNGVRHTDVVPPLAQRRYEPIKISCDFLSSASAFSRRVPGFKILIKSYLTYYLKPEKEDSPGNGPQPFNETLVNRYRVDPPLGRGYLFFLCSFLPFSPPGLSSTLFFLLQTNYPRKSKVGMG